MCFCVYMERLCKDKKCQWLDYFLLIKLLDSNLNGGNRKRSEQNGTAR